LAFFYVYVQTLLPLFLLNNLIQIKNLVISSGEKTLLQLPAFDAEESEVHAVIGESGSGKSLLLKMLIGLLPKNLSAAGEINLHIKGVPDLPLSDWTYKNWLAARGKYVGMVFQEPLSALNPQMTCGAQLREAWNIHAPANRKNQDAELLERLADVGLADDAIRVLNSYPHQLSGGQRQRVVIAMATLHKPRIILADEPTTALDFFSRKQVLTDLVHVVRKLNATLIWVTHELDVVADFADRLTVLRRGELIQSGQVNEVLKERPSEYVQDLLNALPQRKVIQSNPENVVLEVNALSKKYGNGMQALNDFSMELKPGETLAVIGTSGSGKSTLAKILVALETASSGTIKINGVPLRQQAPTGIQMVFQDPFSSLNRRHTAWQSMMEVRKVCFPKESESERSAEVEAGLNEVAFGPDLWHKRPTQMSGGQRQRLCIAKALAANPSILILDEAVAALDPLVQQQVLTLLRKIQIERQLIFVFITHDLAVASSVADKMIYLERGQIKPIPMEWMAHMP
jgi:peptide/nickel transport system ATP-binding protein